MKITVGVYVLLVIRGTPRSKRKESSAASDRYKRQEFEYRDIRDDLKADAEKYRSELIESAVEQDDEVMEAYLEGNEPDVDTIKRCIRTGVLNQSFVPVLNGTAFKNKGVQPLLDAVVDFMPSPIDVEAIKGVHPDTDE